MLLIHSELTKELAPCTIATGVILSNGERIGAIADVDMFAAFTVDMQEASQKYNRRYPHKKPLNGKGDLWEVRKLKIPAINKAASQSTAQPIGIEELKRRYESGCDLWGGEELPAGAQNDKGIDDSEYVPTVGDDE